MKKGIALICPLFFSGFKNVLVSMQSGYMIDLWFYIRYFAGPIPCRYLI